MVSDADGAETLIGEQVRALRLRRGLDQAQLADAAGISLGAVKNLERGSGSTLRSLSRVVAALDRDDWLQQLAPASTVSPIEILRQGRRPRRSRVYRPRSEHG
jgi:transcriptional regulator with XRE-family HTH domain